MWKNYFLNLILAIESLRVWFTDKVSSVARFCKVPVMMALINKIVNQFIIQFLNIILLLLVFFTALDFRFFLKFRHVLYTNTEWRKSLYSWVTLGSLRILTSAPLLVTVISTLINWNALGMSEISLQPFF